MLDSFEQDKSNQKCSSLSMSVKLLDANLNLYHPTRVLVFVDFSFWRLDLGQLDFG